MPDPRLGWKKDKFDRRDYLHRPKLKVPPSWVDLGNLLPEVRNQGSVGSCVGFGIGANVGSVAKALSIFTEWYSPTWIYNGARFMEGTLPFDIGCYPKDALDWLVKMGCLLEHFWPYNPNKLDMAPPSTTRIKQAIKYGNFQYFRIDNGVDGIMSALADGHLVSIGTPWFDTWMNPTGGVLDNVSEDDPVAGGHETILYGYDSTIKLFMGQNSWGKSWAAEGKFSMPYQAFDVFKQLGGYDAHYVTFNATQGKGCLGQLMFWRQREKLPVP